MGEILLNICCTIDCRMGGEGGTRFEIPMADISEPGFNYATCATKSGEHSCSLASHLGIVEGLAERARSSVG